MALVFFWVLVGWCIETSKYGKNTAKKKLNKIWVWTTVIMYNCSAPPPGCYWQNRAVPQIRVIYFLNSSSTQMHVFMICWTDEVVCNFRVFCCQDHKDKYIADLKAYKGRFSSSLKYHDTCVAYQWAMLRLLWLNGEKGLPYKDSTDWNPGFKQAICTPLKRKLVSNQIHSLVWSPNLGALAWVMKLWVKNENII